MQKTTLIPTLDQRLTRLTAIMKESPIMQPDEIDFSWWGDEDLINFALDYDKVKALNEDDSDALIYALARRLDEVVFDVGG